MLTEPLFEQDVDAGREQEVTREELLSGALEGMGDPHLQNGIGGGGISFRVTHFPFCGWKTEKMELWDPPTPSPLR